MYKAWNNIFTELATGAFNYRSSSLARLRFDDNNSVYGDDFDSFAAMVRVINMMAYYLYKDDTPEEIVYNNKHYDLRKFIRDAILNGIDFQNEDYWGILCDRSSKLVEVNDLAFSLWLIRKRNFFTSDEEDRIFKWLDKAYECVFLDSSWKMTPILLYAVEKALGRQRPYPIDSYVSQIELMHKCEGWYSDSLKEPTFDYYTAWLVNYTLLQIVLVDRETLPNADEVISRAQMFLEKFPYMFGANGCNVAFGRSLAYRFAVVAPLILAIKLDICPLDHNTARAVIHKNFLFFMKNKDDIIKNGKLVYGFIKQPKENYELYSFYGSPYWCNRSFACFMFDQNHWIWKSEPSDLLPVEKEDFIVNNKATLFSLCGCKKTGEVRMLSAKNLAGTIKKSEPLYSKVMYSSHFYPNYVFRKFSFPSDEILYCSDKNGDFFIIKKILEADNKGNYLWRHMQQGYNRGKSEADIWSLIILVNDYTIRIHRVKSLLQELFVEEGTLCIEKNDMFSSSIDSYDCYATNENRTIYMKRILGYENIGIRDNWQTEVNMNIVHENSAFIYSESKTPIIKDKEILFVSISYETPECVGKEKIRENLPTLSLHEDALVINENKEDEILINDKIVLNNIFKGDKL